jgi:hypothetical protein
LIEYNVLPRRARRQLDNAALSRLKITCGFNPDFPVVVASKNIVGMCHHVQLFPWVADYSPAQNGQLGKDRICRAEFFAMVLQISSQSCIVLAGKRRNFRIPAL